ncbi:uncharacterized protein LOC117315645 isoform X2 [Pecten maximus]|uniref:uncharacterized protein LOC117315645 isoform X2 n=1 Tax=Pecten maximus TaxID=6579 RepID=UPI001458E117|nr:uncharacterized protein LOC117315645 isoform X2 [Pecten maximus]
MAFLGETCSIYSGRILLLSLVILQYAYRANGALGPLCYECDHMPHQRDCGKIVRCGSHESCYGLKYVTSDSHVFFRSGCKDTSTCGVGKRDDRTLCSSCCSKDFCNIQTCDQPVTLKHRCLACDYVIKPTDCDLSKQCDDDEICYTEEVYNVNSEKRFRLGCARTSSCRSPPPVLVGKRGDISQRQTNSLPLTTSYCSKCCSGENCNRQLCNGTDTGTDLLIPPALLVCFDYDEVACRQLIANDPAPCFDKKIKNMLCPRTCGTCTGGGPGIVVGSTATPGQVPGKTPSPGSCVDIGDRCGIDAATTTLICNISPQLCQKTCGICGGSTLKPASTAQPAPTCNDPISDCQCKYLDEQLHICDDPDPQVKMFCCYYCSKKRHTYTCPDNQCDTIEQQEFDRIQKLGISITCHSDIHIK